MQILKIKQRRTFYVSLVAALLVFTASLSAVLYFGATETVRAEHRSNTSLHELDQALIALKQKKIAEKKAKAGAERKAKEAAEKTAAANTALTAQLQGQIVTPKGCAASDEHSHPSLINVIINKKRCFNPIDFTPIDLASYEGFLISAKAIPDLTAMFAAAAQAGAPLRLTSSYRSYENQVTTYNHWVATNGSTKAADTVSARPGYSEHQTGLAIDLAAGNCSLECFRGSAQYLWMTNNAANHGFIERYPTGFESITGYSPEAWHWRYVGPATAHAMKSSGSKTLEQFWGVQGGDY